MVEIKEATQNKHRFLAIAMAIVAIAMAIYQLLYTQILIQDPTGHRITHFGFCLVVVFLSLLLQRKRGRLVYWGLLVTSVVVTGYLMYFLSELLHFRSAQPFIADIVIYGVIILIAFAGTYLVFGKTFPIVAAVSLAYVILGRNLPFPFTVAPVPIERLLMWLGSVGLEEGLYGDILAISANYLFLFIFFGALLHAMGGLRFIMGVANWLGAKLKSGPAAVAVMSSSLLGTITGSTTANITITGTFTIPLMKAAGYKPEQAGAIEAVASNGGQIMPPIMGATAFVMAGYSGIPYIQIITAALVPAIIYFGMVFLYVEITARKTDIKVTKVPVNGKQLSLDAPLFFVPIGVLVFLLIEGFSLPFVGFWAMMSLIVIGLLTNLRKEARLDFKEVLEKITGGVRTAAEVGMTCGLIGVVATCIKVSGLGAMLPMMIQDISGGHVIIALLIGMVSSVILGMGLPTTAAYVLVAIGLVPALVAMGVPLLAAHLFTFIFAIFSHLTPPVAFGALIASRMAGADYWKTSKEALKAAFTAFLLPFFIIYAPVIILRPEGGILSIAKMIGIISGVVLLQFGISNYCFGLLRQYERIALIIAGLLCVAFVFTGGYIYFFIGTALFLAIIAWRFRQKRQLKAVGS